MIKMRPVDPNNLPDPSDGPFLVTNNLNAQTAYGTPSHVWVVRMLHKGDKMLEGDVFAFWDDHRKVSNVTHYCPIRWEEA